MPLDDRTLRIVEQADRVLGGIEQQTITAMEDALQTSYNRLEAELLAKYRQNASNLDLLPNQRKLLILGQLKNNLDLVGGVEAKSLRASLTSALTQSSEEGAALAKALAKSIGNEDLSNFDAIPLEALRFQAEQGIDRLIQHGQAFAGRASSIVEIGLTTGAGPKKVAAELRKQLGVTKGRAVAIARTETLSSHNQAAQAAYQRFGIEYFQLISTQDARTCPICAARNMQVYKLGESTPPTHPQCRCYSLPFRPEWQEQGLSGDEWAADFRAGAIAELEGIGRKPDNGPSPFEKAAGLPAPKVMWSPGGISRPQVTPPAPIVNISPVEQTELGGGDFAYEFEANDYLVRMFITDGDVNFSVLKTAEAYTSNATGFDTADTTPDEAAAISKKLLSTIRQDARDRPDGYEYKTSAWTADGRGATRTLAYTAVGFSRPLGGNEGGKQYAIVEGGRLRPNLKRLAQVEAAFDPEDIAQAEKRFDLLKSKRAEEKRARTR